jgi:hypothetical protein
VHQTVLQGLTKKISKIKVLQPKITSPSKEMTEAETPSFVEKKTQKQRRKPFIILARKINKKKMQKTINE